jgi:hypothetical protein
VRSTPSRTCYENCSFLTSWIVGEKALFLKELAAPPNTRTAGFIESSVMCHYANSEAAKLAECIGAAAEDGISADDLEKAAGGSLKEYLRTAIINTSE